jgi:hypothetical protein
VSSFRGRADQTQAPVILNQNRTLSFLVRALDLSYDLLIPSFTFQPDSAIAEIRIFSHSLSDLAGSPVMTPKSTVHRFDQ